MLHLDGRYTPTPPPEDRDLRLTPVGRKPLDMSPTRPAEIAAAAGLMAFLWLAAFVVAFLAFALVGGALFPDYITVARAAFFAGAFSLGAASPIIVSVVVEWQDFRDYVFRDGA